MQTGIIAIIFILFSFVSCRNDKVSEKTNQKLGKREMADVNKYLVQKDREVIENYIERKNLRMSESPTGLWYLISQEGSGEFLKDYDKLTMVYDCSLLDGTTCYSSAETGPKEIILGKTDIEQGMNEGLRMLKYGAEATFILPPFLSYGLVGDGKKIPPRTTIVYKVKILEGKKRI